MSRTVSEGRLIQVYRSATRADTYLYLPKAASVEALPETLRRGFGRAVPVLLLWVTPDKPLARVNARDLLAAMQDPGYYLQMPDREQGTEQKLADLGEAVTRLASPRNGGGRV